MDDPGLPEGDHVAALRGLARLNRAAFAHRIAWPSIQRVAASAARDGRTAVVLDAACGSADAAVALAARAQRAGLRIRWRACDISPRALEVAGRAARSAGVALETCTADAVAGTLPAGNDLVTCSLFLHHLDRDDAVRALAAMRAAAASGAVVDLDRTAAGLALAWAASRLLTRSPVVHLDATASVRAAWTPEEALAMARDAGIERPRVDRAWPQRWLLRWGDA
jgi:2-polyprenyl-3-methyl-5-hydroxy-6-metoxy-1,4-benzoquinol methylase